MHTTNYTDTFIVVAPDSTAERGTVPKVAKEPTVAARTYAMIKDHPYRYTSDDVIFGVYADRMGIAKAERAAARKAFFSKGQACLRSSDLGKRYGWGIHSDAKGRIALYGVETPEYAAFASSGAVTVRPAMRSRR